MCGLHELAPAVRAIGQAASEGDARMLGRAVEHLHGVMSELVEEDPVELLRRQGIAVMTEEQLRLRRRQELMVTSEGWERTRWASLGGQ